MSLEEAEIIDETAEILSVPGALKEIKEGWKEARQGKGVSLSALRLSSLKKRKKILKKILSGW